MAGLREQMNENRAKQGLNALPTGKTGKGDRPRQSDLPSWWWMEEVGEVGNSIKFRVSEGHYKLVSKKQVEEVRARLS